MAKKINITQSTIQEVNAPNTFVKKLYDMIMQKENFGGIYDNTSNFIGEITLGNPSYGEWINKIHEHFPQLIINSDLYILFQDPEVERIMSEYLLSKGIGDGHGITDINAKDIKITSIPKFKNNTTIEYFNELPYFEKVTTLQIECFQLCSNLKEIDLSNITTLSQSANGMTGNMFEKCTSLYKVILGNINYIPNKCFNGCTNLEIVENSENITIINTSGFSGCISLENIDLSNLTNIYAYGFQNCSLLGTVNLDNIVTIGTESFGGCTNLKLENSTLSNCTSIGDGGFNTCTLITEIILPICTSIGKESFKNCTGLINISIPQVTSIGINAFVRCSALINCSMPNVQTINNNAFFGCTNLKLNSSSLLNCTSIGTGAFQECKAIIEVNLPICTNLGESTFNTCTSLTTISIPQITSIRNNVFKNCSALTNVSLPNITSIEESAFYGCSSLQNIDLSNVTNIDKQAFSTCNLQTVNLTNVTTLGYAALWHNYNLTLTTGNLPNLITIGQQCFEETKISSLNIPNCQSIGIKAFKNCKSLATVTTNCTDIGMGAFTDCTNLQVISNLTDIIATTTDHILFSNCTSLVFPSHITINNTYIGYCTFYCCGITSVTLGTNVKSLYRSAFQGCSQLTTINGLENITHIGSYTFKDCENLEGIINLSNLEGFVTGKIETQEQSGSTQMFYNCKKITKVIFGHLPDISISAYNNASSPFQGCTSLHTVDITLIDTMNLKHNSIFNGTCTNMQHLILRCNVPTTTHDRDTLLWSYIMQNTNGKIYVPDEYLNNYKTAQYWSDIATHIYPLSEYVPIED